MPEAGEDFDFYFVPRGRSACLVWKKKSGKSGRNYGDYWAVGSLQEPR
jgi:hypothetical protein